MPSLSILCSKEGPGVSAQAPSTKPRMNLGAPFTLALSEATALTIGVRATTTGDAVRYGATGLNGQSLIDAKTGEAHLVYGGKARETVEFWAQGKHGRARWKLHLRWYPAEIDKAQPSVTKPLGGACTIHPHVSDLYVVNLDGDPELDVLYTQVIPQGQGATRQHLILNRGFFARILGPGGPGDAHVGQDSIRLHRDPEGRRLIGFHHDQSAGVVRLHRVDTEKNKLERVANIDGIDIGARFCFLHDAKGRLVAVENWSNGKAKLYRYDDSVGEYLESVPYAQPQSLCRQAGRHGDTAPAPKRWPVTPPDMPPEKK